MVKIDVLTIMIVSLSFSKKIPCYGGPANLDFARAESKDEVIVKIAKHYYAGTITSNTSRSVGCDRKQSALLEFTKD